MVTTSNPTCAQRYGDFVSIAGDIGVTLTGHITANAGYTLGTRLNVTGTPKRIGLDLTQKGTLVLLQFSFDSQAPVSFDGICQHAD